MVAPNKGRVGYNPDWGLNLLFPLFRPLAYKTACTTVQAVIRS